MPTAHPVLRPAPPVDATCGGRLVAAPSRVDTGPRPVRRPQLPLSVLATDLPPLRFARNKPVDLGTHEILRGYGPDTGAVDLGRRPLPERVVGDRLPPEIAKHWRAFYQASARARAAERHKATVEPALGSCAGCAEHACLAAAAERDTRAIAGARRRIKLEQGWLAERLRAVTDAGGARPAEYVARAYILATLAIDSPDAHAAAGATLRLYDRAIAASADPADPLVVWARYFRAGGLEDAGRAGAASRAWRELADAPKRWFAELSPHDALELRQEAAFHWGSLDADPSVALSALGRLRGSTVQDFAVLAALEAATVASNHALPRQALEAAAELASFPDFDEHLTSGIVAWAFDSTAGDAAEGVELPRPVVARAALDAATTALGRGDVARAQALWHKVASLAPGSDLERQAVAARGKRPVAPDARTALMARATALARSCAYAGSVELAGRTVRPSDKASVKLARCMSQHEAYYFAADPPLAVFRAKLVVSLRVEKRVHNEPGL